MTLLVLPLYGAVCYRCQRQKFQKEFAPTLGGLSMAGQEQARGTTKMVRIMYL